MVWVRMKRGMLVANFGACQGVVERTEHGRPWSARVEAPDEAYQSLVDHPSMTEAQAWVEQQIETLLRTPRLTP